MIDWSDLPILLAVEDAGSFTAAAAKLGVSQPTVGRRIQALEEKLGAAVVSRDNGGLELTAFGHVVLDHARRMQDEAAAIARAAVSQDVSLAGPVVFTASEGVGPDWLPRALTGFHRANPDILIDIHIDNHMTNLAQRQADIALRWNGPGTQQSLIGKRAAHVGAGLYAAKSYLDARGRPQRPHDLVDHDAIGWTWAGTFTWPETIDGEASLPARTAFQANSPNALLAGLAAGYGIGFFTHRSARRRPELERVLPGFEKTLDLWAVVHEDVRKSARIRAAFDYVVEALDADRAHFARGEKSVFDDTSDAPVQASPRPAPAMAG